MITVRKAQERGHFDFGWLDTYHTFSFGDYVDPRHNQFSNLRVINEDWVQAGQGFGTHSHKNMEIVTYVLQGALSHQDSMGNGSTIRPGNVQRMSAGKGVTHSEFNHSQIEIVHLLQIWILPRERDISPSYEELPIPSQEKQGKLRIIASSNKGDPAVFLNADAKIYASQLMKKQILHVDPSKDRRYWIQVAKGSIHVNDSLLNAGDGASIVNENNLTIKAEEESEFLLFELP